MYVSYERFLEHTLGAVPPHPKEDDSKQEFDGLTEKQYAHVAPMADLIIDDWTLERVGRAVRNGEELPQSVVTLYVAICEAIPGIMDGAKSGSTGLVTSFSNGVDSYNFQVTEDMATALENQLGWMVDLLPIEWCSAVVSFKGGNAYAG